VNAWAGNRNVAPNPLSSPAVSEGRQRKGDIKDRSALRAAEELQDPDFRTADSWSGNDHNTTVFTRVFQISRIVRESRRRLFLVVKTLMRAIMPP